MSVAVNIWIKLFPVHVTGNGAQSKKARHWLSYKCSLFGKVTTEHK